MIKIMLKNGAKSLERATPLASGADLKCVGYSIIEESTNSIIEPVYFDDINNSVIVAPMQRILLKTGVHIEPEIPYKDEDGNIYIIDVQIRNRSGLSIKQGGLVMLGTGDVDFRGEYGCMFINLSSKDITIKENDAVGQLVLGFAVIPKEFQYVSKLSDSVRGVNGFGSSDKKVV